MQSTRASTTVLTLVTGGPIGRRSEVTFRATVSPSTATGVVRFEFRQVRSGSALVRVVDGRAEFTTNLFDIGTHSAIATFDPDPATGLAGSTSAERTFVVTSNPGLSQSSTAGSALIPGSALWGHTSQNAPGDVAGITSSGANGTELSHTGGDPLELLLMASVLIVVGARLARVRATRPGLGRHVVVNVGGRHQSFVG